MKKQERVDSPLPPAWGHQADFEYHSAPRIGLNWPFAQALIMGVIVWSTVAASMTFWGCLLAALLR